MQRQVPGLGVGLTGDQDLAGHSGQVEGLRLVQACLPPRQGEQRFDELLLLGTGGQDPLMRGAQCFDRAVGVGQGDLADDSLAGQRGTQLVRGVGDELALGTEGRLKPGEQRVEGIPEFPELVAGAVEGEAIT